MSTGDRLDERILTELLELRKETGELKTIVVERSEAFENMRNQSIEDALTGLPTRTIFRDRLSLAIAQARRNRQMIAVVYLGLDRFKLINDSLGHQVGDFMLQSVAVRLNELMRKSDTVARINGDVFALILPDIVKMENAARVGQKILTCFEEPLEIDGKELVMSVTTGIAFFPNDGEDAESLMKNAETAMYRTKEECRGTYRFYTPAMNSRAFERLALENDLRRAIERQEIIVYYQPKVNIQTGLIIGMEALARWRHGEKGIISPGEFIPLAEETGLIISIGEKVLRTACTQNQKWQRAGLPPMRVAVNLSVRQFQQKNLLEMVDNILSETGMDPAWLELEITESVAMQDAEFTVEILKSFKERGIKISLDDFGTGYSSLNYLKRFPINTLKIDQSFVRDITTNPDDTAIASAVIALAQSLRLEVVAEGVETVEQLKVLRDRECLEMQGYLFGRPVPAEEFEEMLKTQYSQPPADASN